MQAVTYSNSSQNPSATTRTLSIVVADDPTKVASTPAVSTVAVVPVNDAPTLSPLTFTPAYVENGPPVTPFPGITLADVDSTNMVSATVRFTSGFVQGQDFLTTTVSGGIVASYNGTTGVLSLTGTSDKSNYQNVLLAVRYANNSDTPATNNRTLAVGVADDGSPKGVSNSVTSTLSVAAINDAPRFTPQAFNVSFTEDGGPVFLNVDLEVADPDSNFIFSATVRVATNYINGQDVLTATAAGPISVAFVPATGILTLSGIATPLDYTAVLQSVAYNNLGNSFPQTTRSIQYTASDDPNKAASTPAVASLTIIATNDPPQINLANTPLSVAENASATRIDTAATVRDPDTTVFNGAIMTVSIGSAIHCDKVEVETGDDVRPQPHRRPHSQRLYATGPDFCPDYQRRTGNRADRLHARQ